MKRIVWRPLLKDWGKVALYGACLSVVLIGGAHAVGALETQVTKVTGALLGNIFTGILAVVYGYVALPLLKEFQMGKFGICTVMAGSLELAVLAIQNGTFKTWFGE
jgi:hypothetical protein